MDWNSSALWGIIGLIGGFIVSFLFFKLSKKKRKLSYSVMPTPIIVNKISKIPDLVIKYKDKNISDLSISKIEIKNIGNETLEPKDFPELNKLSLITNGQFLINSIDELEINTSNLYIKVTPNLVSLNKIELTFDFLDPKNTIFCNIFHTGKVDVCGTIKNGKLIRVDYSNIEKTEVLIRNIQLSIVIIAGIIASISVVISLFIKFL